MLISTYKNTLKTLFRSALFWLTVLLVLALMVERGLSVQSSRAVVVNGRPTGEMIMDNEPEFRENIDHNFYVQTVQNSQNSWIMLYTMPLLAVISTMIMLTRDYRDNLYEIEKAGGVRPSKYFFGRFAALVTVNFTVCLIFGHVGLHTYFFSRGGPPDFFANYLEYFMDSTQRILRVFFGAQIFTLLFYIGITYVFGCILHSGFMGGVAGIGSVLFVYLSQTSIRHRMPTVYLDYLVPRSNNHYAYLGLYDSELFYHPYGNPFTVNDVMICIVYLFVASLIFFTVSYIFTRKRSI